MNFNCKRVSDKMYIYLNGELDEYFAAATRDELDGVISDAKGITAVIFDLSNLRFMDSTGLGFLLGRYNRIKKRNIPVYVRSAPLSIEKILCMSGVYDIMPKL